MARRQLIFSTNGAAMGYIWLGIYLLFCGLLLLGGDSGSLRGSKMFIDFVAYKNPAGLVFLFAAFFAFRRGLRGTDRE